MSDVNLQSPFDAYDGDEPFVFVSYAHKNGRQVFQEIKRLHDLGVRIWFDGGIDPGNEWAEDIHKALIKSHMFLVFITPASVESNNVRDEISLALNKKKQFLAVHLQKTQLLDGLELRMNRLQAILKYNMTEENYNKKLWSSFSKQDVIDRKNLRLKNEKKPELNLITRLYKNNFLKSIIVSSIFILIVFCLVIFGPSYFGKVSSTNQITVISNDVISKVPALNQNKIVLPASDAVLPNAKLKGAAPNQNKIMTEDLGNGISLDMVLIPAGKFKMGPPKKDVEVTLTKPYFMGKYEVTQEQWESVMGSNPSDTKEAKFPVTNVSWNDCQDFIKKLNDKTKSGYRLPTEAEWEYACRAGTSTAYSFGDIVMKSDANFNFSEGNVGIKVAGGYKPNAFGLYNMHGNVSEWCQDFEEDIDIFSGGVIDPKGPSTGSYRVCRGGSFNTSFDSIQSTSFFREGFPLSRPDREVGFRLARTK